MKIGMWWVRAIAAGIILGIVIGIIYLQVENHNTIPPKTARVVSGPQLAFQAPVATSIAELVAQSDIIVFAQATQMVWSAQTLGYDGSGDLIVPETPTPTPTGTVSSPGIATATRTPEPPGTVLMTDYDLSVSSTLLDDGLISGNGIPRLRLVEGSGVNATDIMSETYLYFLTKNPDNTTYGLFGGGCSRFDTSGSVVACSGGNSSSYYGPTEGMTGQQFVDAVETVIANGTATPTPTP